MKTTLKPKNNLQAPPKKPDPSEQLAFVEHVHELRRRLVWVVATLLGASALGFYVKDALVGFVMSPLQGEKLIYLTPGGGFSFIFTLCLYFGAFFAVPVAVYHIYRFLQPLMHGASKKLLAGVIVLSISLALCGAVFGYVVAIPAAITFLTGFAGDAVTASLTAESYLAFVMAYMLGLAVLFQLPLLLFVADHIRRFPPGALLSTQRFVIVGAVVAAAIITPTPDVVNQMVIAGPIIGMYQLGVVAIWMRRRREVSAPVPEVPEELVANVREETPAPAAVPRRVAPPVAVPARTAPPTSRPRTIDGFVRSTPLGARPGQQVVAASRPMRSLDGFIVVPKTSP